MILILNTNTMKISNSRDKNIKTQATLPANKLHKTDIQQTVKHQQMERTNYNRPASGKKIQSNKNIPPKPLGAKKEYIVEDNMTQSRINQAKQGLQLLKKKLNTRGQSRQKIAVQQQPQQQKNIASFKKIPSKNEDTQYYQNRNNNMPPKKVNKKYEEEPTQSIPPISSKQISSKNINDVKKTLQNQRKIPSKPSYEQYRNQQIQIPIKPKKDFNALLEQQLRKQNQGKQNSITVTNNQKKVSHNDQIDQYPDQNLQMVQCRHCERKFNEAAIEKHQKICLKVFLTKRKAFDSAAHRAPEVEGIQQIQIQNKKSETTKAPAKKKAPPAKKQQEALPKWKAQSLAFRANLKAAKGATLTAQQKKATQTAQGLVQCSHCGRKFNQNAAARHIPFCETKSKQLPKTTMTKKK